MKSLMTAGLALALGLVWTAGPALAQQTTGEKIEKKTEKTADKAESKMDKAKDKAVELKDKAKEKTTELKDKVKSKTDKAADKMEAKADKADVSARQQALKDKGHDPGPIDGIMGPRTRAALQDYQRKEGLKVTGRWDDDTIAKLGVTATPSASPPTATSPTSPSASPPSTPSAAPSASTQPPATPEDKTAPPAKKQNP